MNLYLLTQNENRGYDTHDSMIVSANSKEEAKQMLPYGDTKWGYTYSTWASKPENVQVTLIGTAIDNISEVKLASFNAG